MARVHYVKRAQQRYATKPVLDNDGNQVVQPIDRTTRNGRQVTVRVTETDYSQPLPNRSCEKCQTEIKVGDPYQWVQPKSGPYGGIKRFRCGKCPSWQLWELSNSLGARLMEVSSDFWSAIDSAQETDDVQSALDDAAGRVRDIAEEKRESAENIRDGFGHDTSQSEELDDVADQLESWADEIESATIPDFPEPDEDTEDIEESDDGNDALEDWIDEIRNDLTIVDEPPV